MKQQECTCKISDLTLKENSAIYQQHSETVYPSTRSYKQTFLLVLCTHTIWIILLLLIFIYILIIFYYTKQSVFSCFITFIIPNNHVIVVHTCVDVTP